MCLTIFEESYQIKIEGKQLTVTIINRISVSQMTVDMFHLSHRHPGLFLIHDLSPDLLLD